MPSSSIKSAPASADRLRQLVSSLATQHATSADAGMQATGISPQARSLYLHTTHYGLSVVNPAALKACWRGDAQVGSSR